VGDTFLMTLYALIVMFYNFFSPEGHTVNYRYEFRNRRRNRSLFNLNERNFITRVVYESATSLWLFHVTCLISHVVVSCVSTT